MRRRPATQDPNIRALERELSARLGLKVTLKAAENGGSLTIAYRTLSQLDAVLARLRAESNKPAEGASAEMG